jgi:hypothetical protein
MFNILISCLIVFSSVCISCIKSKRSILLPFTSEEQLIPCSVYFNEKEEFDKSLECLVDSRDSIDKLHLPLPECYVVSKESVDVVQTSSYNYIRMSILSFASGGFLGYYDHNRVIVYVVETYDMKDIYYHEIGHYVLHFVYGDPDSTHSDIFWKQCSSTYYTPSQESIENNSKR